MEKIDRLGWADGLAVSCDGVRIGIRVTDPAILCRVRECLPPARRALRNPVVDYLYSVKAGGGSPRAGVRNYNLVYSGASNLVRTLDIDEAMQSLRNVLGEHVAALSTRRIYVRASLLEFNGQAIVIPGAPDSARSKLLKALEESGARRLSDDWAVFESDGRVRGPGGVRHALPMGLLAAISFRDRARWRPKELTPGQTLMHLAAHAPCIRYRPQAALSHLKATVGAPAIIGDYRELDRAAKNLLDCLSRLD